MFNNKVNVETIFKDETILASGTKTSHEIELPLAEGLFSLYVEVSGSGTVKLEAEIEVGECGFLVPVEHTDIVTAHTVSSGAGSDGKDIYTVTACIGSGLKIKATETGGADPIVLKKVVLAWQ